MLVAQAKRAAELFNTKIPDSKNDDIYHKLSLEMKNIILIGMPGSGKTTVGKRIAEALNRDFIDTDEMIEQRMLANPFPTYLQTAVKSSSENMSTRRCLRRASSAAR